MSLAPRRRHDDTDDLGSPGPADDDAHRHSYLYEHVIDALVIFASRYLRTALLLARRPSRAADRLLDDSDNRRGEYTRPLAFLAISYMLFVIVLSGAPALAQLISEGTIDLSTTGGSPEQLILPFAQLLSQYGDVETDYLVVAILAPLPAVVLVSIATTVLSGTLGGADAYDRSRFAWLVQYSVGLGMFSTVWFIVQSLGLVWIIVSLIDAYEISWGDDARFFGLVSFAAFAGLVSLATILLILAISILPVWRVLKVRPTLARMNVFTRAILSLSGPTVMAGTLVAIQGLVSLAERLAAPPLSLHVAHGEMSGKQLSVTGAVQANGDQPVAILDWRMLWRGSDDRLTQCHNIAMDGDLVVTHGEHSAPVMEAIAPTLLDAEQATMRDGVLYLDPGEAVWVRVDSPRPDAPAFRGPDADWLLCVKTSRHRHGWLALVE